MKEINISADKLVRSLLRLSEGEQVCLLDSSGVEYLDSQLLIAGINPLETLALTNDDTDETLKLFDEKLNCNSTATIFTISYDFGLRLETIPLREQKSRSVQEPDVFMVTFDTLIIHNYKTSKTYLQGNKRRFDEIFNRISETASGIDEQLSETSRPLVSSNFTKVEYIEAVQKIRELIKQGETYQTNLTQQFRAELGINTSPQRIFSTLRNSHPGAFSAFIKRIDDYVVSISPERFAKISEGKIITSPIKGTRERGLNEESDRQLARDLTSSEKDRAENTMIVDLLRNDIGRVCEFGSVKVEKLCELETHPTLFHLVSTISGKLKNDVAPSEIIKAIFPCGSITGCPKISTMKLIDNLEPANRGLSMGAIGYCDFDNNIEMSVAIRTMVVRNNEALFNVGGGIVIDSDPESEYEESLLKAKALLAALNS